MLEVALGRLKKTFFWDLGIVLLGVRIFGKSIWSWDFWNFFLGTCLGFLSRRLGSGCMFQNVVV